MDDITAKEDFGGGDVTAAVPAIATVVNTLHNRLVKDRDKTVLLLKRLEDIANAFHY